MSQQLPERYSHLLRYDSTWRLLICRICKIALTSDGLPQHLRRVHAIKAKDRKEILATLSPFLLIDNDTSLPKPPDYSLPIEGLAIYDAFKCIGVDFVTKSDQLARRHFEKKHPEF